ncbi:3700_t:CDS:2 [Funneliformis mosseae]|uniref:3700_t:CDS:1 n=1 Tax=Funneliformis mosseae TaxID=27381 RepID=A0A9N8W3B8_FUNMO|nr:3700_t:CDS:2 [Funneliformis mosseae]
MSKTCKLIPFKHREIVSLLKGRHSIRNISEILGKPKSTVHNVIMKYNKEYCINTAFRSGRPPALSEQNKRQTKKNKC